MTWTGPNWKPAKGTALMERRQRRKDIVAHEETEKATGPA